ncbi:transcriptional regulator GcvA [Chitinimonas sp.]|uniref:transcriptional regulator GcvA n=1 Tax=Chitinimonas sp. TaxID=1934313 RepID=UPI002F923061
MRRRLPPLNSLRAFEAAARLGSFSLAAEELSVTHGAVSRHVQQLEGWLGLALFERLNRRVVLTDAGRDYMDEVGAALDRIALATALQLERGRQRVLRVNAPATFTLRWLLPRLSDFQRLHPTLEVRISTSNEVVEALTTPHDLVIRGGPQQIAGYVGEEFLCEQRLPVCSPAILKNAPLKKPADLARHTLLHAATYPSMWDEWLSAAGVPGLQPKQSLTLEHFYLTLQAALDGLGVAMGPQALVAQDVAEGRLVHPFAITAPTPWRYWGYIPERRAGDAGVQAFLSWLRAASI